MQARVLPRQRFIGRTREVIEAFFDLGGGESDVQGRSRHLALDGSVRPPCRQTIESRGARIE